MKLLIVTQKADQSDFILGFFHSWLGAFASRTGHLTVLAQYVGQVSLPSNATVCSLGKERGRPVWRQILTFWRLIWRMRSQYGCVFVHMTPVWVILGWPVWFLLRKRVYLWYEIRRGSWLLTLALLLVRKVFCATVQGLPRPHRKQVVTGHGIDADTFRPDLALRKANCIVAVGRISRSKRYDEILRAFALLPQTSRLVIAGGVMTQADEGEWENVQALLMQSGVAGRVEVRWIDPSEMPAFLQRATLMLHACVGGLDKAVLEAMASGCPVVSSSAAAQEVLPERCRATPETLGEVARSVLALSEQERRILSEEVRRKIVKGHSLPGLIERLAREME
ncbi:MAG: glycosyltransferase family 4 protein [Candidatus Peribacteraceae bacterium]|nr:glycosyltransferase family 4 protein [Candidatus Peribacteraceae bacterium]MDD5742204.1 glycosyltransferase family 4 protein [Candidatus Peribacteraceae bacterium]